MVCSMISYARQSFQHSSFQGFRKILIRSGTSLHRFHDESRLFGEPQKPTGQAGETPVQSGSRPTAADYTKSGPDRLRQLAVGEEAMRIIPMSPIDPYGWFHYPPTRNKRREPISVLNLSGIL